VKGLTKLIEDVKSTIIWVAHCVVWKEPNISYEILPPTSGMKSTPSKKPSEVETSWAHCLLLLVFYLAYTLSLKMEAMFLKSVWLSLNYKAL
jgi:hypothetical protein